MSAVYNKAGLSFVYPSNWTIDESEGGEGQRGAVTAQSGEGAFWTVIRESSATEPEFAAQTALEALKDEYDELDAEPAMDTLEGYELCGFDTNFICLDLTSTALIRATRTRDATLVFFCQADDREFADVANVFAAMTMSVLQHLGA
ncbi:MAG: hypothetical protein MPJ50_07935 [Pirellulales bacterium]|nr:hypothetical protein [Pirellulales bacterium]